MADKKTDTPQNYVLKRGLKHSYVINGERVNVVGDGKGTIPLSPEQAKNFAGKLESTSPSNGELLLNTSAEAGPATADTVATQASNEEAKEEATKEETKPAEKPAAEKK